MPSTEVLAQAIWEQLAGDISDAGAICTVLNCMKQKIILLNISEHYKIQKLHFTE